MRQAFGADVFWRSALAAWIAAAASLCPAQVQPPAQTPNGDPFVGALLIETSEAPFRDPIRLGRLVEELKRWPFRTVVVQVRVFGDAYYDSEIVPRALGMSDRFDPLGELILRLGAEPNPIQVWAWLVPYRVGNVNRAAPLDDLHILRRRPNWLSRNSRYETEDERGMQYLEPGLPEVQSHLESVAAELASRYAVSAIVFDEMRYPGLDSDWGYHPDVLQIWRRRTGEINQPAPDDESWRQVRREIVNDSLRGMARAAKRARPEIATAAFALASGPPPDPAGGFARSAVYRGALQDWPHWAAEGAVDLILMRNERARESRLEEFTKWNEFALSAVSETSAEVLPIIEGSINFSIDSLELMRGVQTAGFMGVALASYQKPLLDEGARELFFQALGKTVLAPSTVRVEPTVVTIPQPAATPEGELPPPPIPESELPPPPTMTPDPAAAPTPPTTQMRSELERLLEQSGMTDRSRGPVMIQSTDRAREYLRKLFPNIFR